MPRKNKAVVLSRDIILERAAEGDKSVLPQLRELLQESPTLLRSAGNIAEQVERSWVGRIAGDNIVVSEAIRMKLTQMHRELSGDNPSLMEKLIVERILACWLQMQYVETIFAQNLSKMDPGAIQHYQKWIEKAQGRYLSAMRTLAVVRRLQVPNVQVNIGEKQINMVNNINQTGEMADEEM